jgi:hypothetical protein
MSDRGKLTYGNFGKFRHVWIQYADRQVAEADEILANPPADRARAKRLQWRAAKFLETAGGFYRRAELGLLAKAAWGLAAEVYGAIGRTDDAATCSRIARSVPDYWTEDEA